MADGPSQYVVQFKLTAAGAASIDAGGNPVETWRGMWVALGGGSDVNIQVTLGDYDFVLFGSIASDAKVAAFGLAVAMEGSATTSSHRAFSPEEAGLIVKEARGVH
jgi:uncharacterized protein with GYD domain